MQSILRFLPEPVPFLLTLIGAIAAVWFLRKKIRTEIQISEVPTEVTQVQPKGGFLSKKGKWALGISLAVAVAFFFGIFAMIGNSEVCQLAMRAAQSNSAVAQRLGQPITRGMFVSGSIEVTPASGHADIAIPVSGPRAKGTLYAVSVKSAGLWKFETLQLAVEGDPKRLDLLQDQEKQEQH